MQASLLIVAGGNLKIILSTNAGSIPIDFNLCDHLIKQGNGFQDVMFMN